MPTRKKCVAALFNCSEELRNQIAKFYQKLKAKKGSQKAITVASAKMLKIIYSVLKN